MRYAGFKETSVNGGLRFANPPTCFFAVPPHAQSLAAWDGDEWQEGTDSISEMLLLAAEFHPVLFLQQGLVEDRDNCRD
jgi:hypothetical protein